MKSFWETYPQVFTGNVKISIYFIQVPHEGCKDGIMRTASMESNYNMIVTNVLWHMEENWQGSCTEMQNRTMSAT